MELTIQEKNEMKEAMKKKRQLKDKKGKRQERSRCIKKEMKEPQLKSIWQH